MDYLMFMCILFYKVRYWLLAFILIAATIKFARFIETFLHVYHASRWQKTRQKRMRTAHAKYLLEKWHL